MCIHHWVADPPPQYQVINDLGNHLVDFCYGHIYLATLCPLGVLTGACLNVISNGLYPCAAHTQLRSPHFMSGNNSSQYILGNSANNRQRALSMTLLYTSTYPWALRIVWYTSRVSNMITTQKCSKRIFELRAIIGTNEVWSTKFGEDSIVRLCSYGGRCSIMQGSWYYQFTKHINCNYAYGLTL